MMNILLLYVKSEKAFVSGHHCSSHHARHFLNEPIEYVKSCIKTITAKKADRYIYNLSKIIRQQQQKYSVLVEPEVCFQQP